jgi:DNA-binding GntR family transcriptional regulator
MPIREAIRQLDAEGYVTIRPNRGAVVTNRTPEQVVELFEIRAALEGLAMRLSIPHVTDDAIEDLKLELARLRRLESNAVAWVDRHDQFHDMICQLSHRPRLCADITRLRLAVKPYLRLYLKHHAKPEIKGYEHEHILEALQSGNGGRAERVMREHVMVNAEAIAGCLPAPREEPTWHPAPRRAAAAPKRNPKRQAHRRPKHRVARRADRGR